MPLEETTKAKSERERELLAEAARSNAEREREHAWRDEREREECERRHVLEFERRLIRVLSRIARATEKLSEARSPTTQDAKFSVPEKE